MDIFKVYRCLVCEPPVSPAYITGHPHTHIQSSRAVRTATKSTKPLPTYVGTYSDIGSIKKPTDHWSPACRSCLGLHRSAVRDHAQEWHDPIRVCPDRPRPFKPWTMHFTNLTMLTVETQLLPAKERRIACHWHHLSAEIKWGLNDQLCYGENGGTRNVTRHRNCDNTVLFF